MLSVIELGFSDLRAMFANRIQASLSGLWTKLDDHILSEKVEDRSSGNLFNISLSLSLSL